MTPILLSLLLGFSDPPPRPKLDAPAPVVRELAPVGPVNARGATPLTVGRFRAVYIENTPGEVAWDVTPRDAADKTVRFAVLPPSTRIYGWLEGTDGPRLHEFPATASDILYVEGLAPGSVTVAAWVNGEKKPKKLAEQVLDVGGGVPPPTDPWVQAAQAAYTSDAAVPGFDKARDLAALAAAYKGMAGKAAGCRTAGDLSQVLKADRVAAVGDRLPNTRGVLAGEFNRLIPTDPATVLTAESRQAAADLLARFAGVLSAVK
jgi:hypothetical protein